METDITNPRLNCKAKGTACDIQIPYRRAVAERATRRQGVLQASMLRFGDGGQAINDGSGNFLLEAAGPGYCDAIDLGRFTQADCDREFGLGQVAAGWHDLAREGMAVDAHFDPGADRVAVTFRADQLEANPVVLQVLVIAQQDRGPT